MTERCDLAGQTYTNKRDGRTIAVLGWCPLTDGYDCPPDGYHHERRVLVQDSTGRVWSTAYEPVKAEIARQVAGRKET